MLANSSSRVVILYCHVRLLRSSWADKTQVQWVTLLTICRDMNTTIQMRSLIFFWETVQMKWNPERESEGKGPSWFAAISTSSRESISSQSQRIHSSLSRRPAFTETVLRILKFTQNVENVDLTTMRPSQMVEMCPCIDISNTYLRYNFIDPPENVRVWMSSCRNSSGIFKSVFFLFVFDNFCQEQVSECDVLWADFGEFVNRDVTFDALNEM